MTAPSPPTPQPASSSPLFTRSTAIAAILGAVSGALSTWVPGPPMDVGPVSLLMVLAGLWFGLVVGALATIRGGAGLLGGLFALAVTWIAWEVAVNVAMILTEGWLAGTSLDKVGRYALGGLAAGIVGAGLSFLGVAAVVREARHAAGMMTATGAGGLFGMLLPLATERDWPIALFVPWQMAVAAAIAWAISRR